MKKNKIIDGVELKFGYPSAAYADMEPLEPTELYALTTFSNVHTNDSNQESSGTN